MIFQKNPWTMVGKLEHCWLFVFRTPICEAKRFLPPQLELITRGGFAFWNAVICRVERLRPAGLPAWAGMGYWHVAYRLYVRHHAEDGRVTSGLYFVRSDCDSPWIASVGRVMTDFRFHDARVLHEGSERWTNLQIESPDAPAMIDIDEGLPARLAAGSPFESLSQAEASLQYSPFGISIRPDGAANIVAIKREESSWQSRIVRVVDQNWGFFKDKDVAPELCYRVSPIDYQWHRGKIVSTRAAPIQEVRRPQPEAVIAVRSVPIG